MVGNVDILSVPVTSQNMKLADVIIGSIPKRIDYV